MSKPDIDTRIDRLFEEIGSNHNDFYEVHTLGAEPDIECIHLTPRAKEALLKLIQEENIKSRISELENLLPNWSNAINMPPHRFIKRRIAELRKGSKHE